MDGPRSESVAGSENPVSATRGRFQRRTGEPATRDARPAAWCGQARSSRADGNGPESIRSAHLPGVAVLEFAMPVTQFNAGNAAVALFRGVGVILLVVSAIHFAVTPAL